MKKRSLFFVLLLTFVCLDAWAGKLYLDHGISLEIPEGWKKGKAKYDQLAFLYSTEYPDSILIITAKPGDSIRDLHVLISHTERGTPEQKREVKSIFLKSFEQTGKNLLSSSLWTEKIGGKKAGVIAVKFEEGDKVMKQVVTHMIPLEDHILFIVAGIKGSVPQNIPDEMDRIKGSIKIEE